MTTKKQPDEHKDGYCPEGGGSIKKIYFIDSVDDILTNDVQLIDCTEVSIDAANDSDIGYDHEFQFVVKPKDCAE